MASSAASGSRSLTAELRARDWTVSVRWGAATNVGNVRQLNEDSLCAEPPVFAVADGMGGHHGGEVAASIAVGVLRSFRPGKPLIQHELRAALVAANTEIFSRSDHGDRVMGTTVTGVAVADLGTPGLLVFNIGDSRTYRLSNGELSQVTRDHSHVQELIEAGEINADQVATHPERNVVTRALGVDPVVAIDVWTLPLERGSRWLACSDGLTAELDHDQLADHLRVADPQAAADALIAEALEGRAADNVSAVIVDVTAVRELEDPDVTDPRRDRSGVVHGDVDVADDPDRTDRRGAGRMAVSSPEFDGFIDEVPWNGLPSQGTRRLLSNGASGSAGQA